MPLKIKILTLFPEMVRVALETSIPGRAQRQGRVDYTVVDIRDFAEDKHRTVDDTAYGGGAGMIMMAPPVVAAVEAHRTTAAAPVVLTTPQGERLQEQRVLELLAKAESAGEILLICGRYKGIDERVRRLVVTDEISVGDFVLSGGELPALMIVDAMVRRIEGVLHDAESAASDSFSRERHGGLDCEWYTKPPIFRGLAVPEVLLSGHHAQIERWRAERAAERTRRRRPDLLDETTPHRSRPPSPVDPERRED
jgi:tRNA (guanine37-N1)-methyltransferase